MLDGMPATASNYYFTWFNKNKKRCNKAALTAYILQSCSIQTLTKSV